MGLNALEIGSAERGAFFRRNMVRVGQLRTKLIKLGEEVINCRVDGGFGI